MRGRETGGREKEGEGERERERERQRHREEKERERERQHLEGTLGGDEDVGRVCVCVSV